MDKSNRIFFKDNPYPKGHRIKEFIWNGRFEPETGLWFDFHLETEKYYEEDKSDDEFEPESDWKSKIGWKNFHACTMSSTKWHYGGILVGTEINKLDFENLQSKILVADKLPLPDDFDLEDLSFYIYLLGHDSCADHKISFVKKHSFDTYDINWTGKIALSYVGDYEFKYELSTNIENVKFSGFEFESEIFDNIENYLLNSDSFETKGKKLLPKAK